jgi:hypothetical protein
LAVDVVRRAVAVRAVKSLSRTRRPEYDAGGGREARVGDGQRQEDRWSLSFSAWIAIAVGLVVMIVLGLHVPVYLTFRYEERTATEIRRKGGYICEVVTVHGQERLPPPRTPRAPRMATARQLIVPR